MPETSAFDLDIYFSLPRVSGLALSPDGTRLVTCVQEAAPDGKRFIGALWELDPTGEQAPRRLTRSTKGESFAAFLPDGSILFTSARPENEPQPDDNGGDDDQARLWVLPADGGEARVVASPANGVALVHAARDAGAVAFLAGRWPGAETDEADAARMKSRKEKGVEAQLFDRYPIRFWDHYLSTARPRLFAAAPPTEDGRLSDVRDLTPDAGPALADQDEIAFDISADGTLVVSVWFRDDGRGKLMGDLVAIDVATGDRRVIASGGENDDWFTAPALSADGTTVATIRYVAGTPDRAARNALWLIDIGTGEARELVSGHDHWPGRPVWTPDGSAIMYAASENGLAPVFRVEATGDQAGEITRLTIDGCYSDVCVAPDGSAAYALASTYASPPEAVRFDPATPDQTPQPLPTPGLPLPVALPGRVESVTTTAASDGVPIQSWLVMPNTATADSRAPLVVFIHGGPLGAWGEWHWRWNPQLLAERGYAVLLPNPALSTGFGQDFIQRGWGRWGAEPYTDVMTAVDGACARPDIDDSRVAAMGGSFGGYMANWVAGQTDRFRCIITHASVYALDGFHGTTDLGVWWEQEFGDPYVDPTRYEEHSPHRHVANVRTPMLVIHGELDHRVPISEALRLWTDLTRHGAEAKFLYFPDENHWILKPNNARVWYEAVFAFLAEHVLDDRAAWKSEYLESLGIGP
ncbi:MAG: S9 family peptidase [Acidimicrobiales bacterium]